MHEKLVADNCLKMPYGFTVNIMEEYGTQGCLIPQKYSPVTFYPRLSALNLVVFNSMQA